MDEGSKTYTQEQLDAELAGLKANRDRALDQAKAAKEALEALRAEHEGLSHTVAELQQRSAAKEAGVSDDQLKEMRSKIRADLEREYAPFKEKLGALEGALSERDTTIRTLTLDNKVKAEMSKAGVIAPKVDALFRLTSDRYDLSEDNEPIVKDSREVPLSKYIMEELSGEYPEWFAGTGSSGGGASKSAGGASGAKRFIAAGDHNAFIANLEGIATGSVEVRQ